MTDLKKLLRIKRKQVTHLRKMLQKAEERRDHAIKLMDSTLNSNYDLQRQVMELVRRPSLPDLKFLIDRNRELEDKLKQKRGR